MSENRSRSLEEHLRVPNHEILTTPYRFADVIWKYESCVWNDAQRKASTLIKTGEASNYLDDLRKHLGVYPPGQEEEKQIQVSTLPVKVSTIPLFEPKPELSETMENYRLLMELAPELEKQLLDFNGENSIGGISAKNIYGSAELTYIEKDSKGFYLQLIINENNASWLKIKMYVDISKKELLVLNYQNADGETKVYDDDFNREMVNLYEQETQTNFVTSRLQKLIRYKLFIVPKRTIAVPEKKETEAEKNPIVQRSYLTPNWDRIHRTYFPENEEDDDEDELEEAESYKAEIQVLKEEKEAQAFASLDHLFFQNFMLLRQLIPTLEDEFHLASFKATVKSSIPGTTDYYFEVSKAGTPDNVEHNVEVYSADDDREPMVIFVLKETRRALFLGNIPEFFGNEEDCFIPPISKPTHFSIHFSCNMALSKFLHFCLINSYKSEIVERYYEATDEEQPNELTTTENSNGVDAGDGLAILGVVTLGILGVFGIRKLF